MPPNPPSFVGANHSCKILDPPLPDDQKLDNTIHLINHYPLDSAIGFAISYPLDSDLSSG